MDILIPILADWLVVPIVLFGFYAFLFKVPKSQKRDVYTRVLLAGLTAYVVAKIIGLLYQPAGLRPFELLGKEAGASSLGNPGFPSDHALFTMAIVLAIWFGAKQKKLAMTAFVLAVLVVIGRVLAMVHTPLDVTGGMLIAFVGIVWYLPFAKSKSPKQKASA